MLECKTYGRWLVQTDRTEEAAALLDEARTIFEGMKATRWLERVAELIPSREPETRSPDSHRPTGGSFCSTALR
jgi:hypothetical protein